MGSCNCIRKGWPAMMEKDLRERVKKHPKFSDSLMVKPRKGSKVINFQRDKINLLKMRETLSRSSDRFSSSVKRTLNETHSKFGMFNCWTHTHSVCQCTQVYSHYTNKEKGKFKKWLDKQTICFHLIFRLMDCCCILIQVLYTGSTGECG